MRRVLIIILAAASLTGCEIRIHKKDKVKAAVAANNSSQRDSIYSAVQPHDTNKLLTILFNPVKIVKGVAYWLPDGDARFNMNVSPDGYCHTNIDHILETDTSVDKCVVVFTTKPYDDSGRVDGGHVQGANYGIAIFDRDGKGYKMEQFERNFTALGAFGEGGDTIALEKFGRDKYFLMIGARWVGGGCCDVETYNYFDITDEDGASTVFSYEPYYSDSLFHEPGDTSAISVEKKLVHIKTADGWRDDLKVITSLEHYSQSKHKWVIDKSECTYSWDDKEAAYVSIKDKRIKIGDDDY